MEDEGGISGFEGMLLSDLVDMVPGLSERLFPTQRILCLIQVCKAFRHCVGEILGREGEKSILRVSLLLKRTLTPQDSGRMQFWKFKACAVTVKVPTNMLIKPVCEAFDDSFQQGWRGPDVLLLNYTGFGPPGAAQLGGILPKCQTLRILNVEKSILGNDGAFSLAEGLSHCSALEKLYLGDCLIASEGAEKLGQALEKCPALTWLDISSNQVEILKSQHPIKPAMCIYDDF